MNFLFLAGIAASTATTPQATSFLRSLVPLATSMTSPRLISVAKRWPKFLPSPSVFSWDQPITAAFADLITLVHSATRPSLPFTFCETTQKLRFDDGDRAFSLARCVPDGSPKSARSNWYFPSGVRATRRPFRSRRCLRCERIEASVPRSASISFMVAPSNSKSSISAFRPPRLPSPNQLTPFSKCGRFGSRINSRVG